MRAKEGFLEIKFITGTLVIYKKKGKKEKLVFLLVQIECVEYVFTSLR